ncbi:MAG: hypothetical protein WDM81_06885 [Rhizomicrobium sp.]
MLADLQTGSYVGAAALKGADGKLRAQGIRVYPPEMRGQGEGEYAIDPANPMRLLINGAVTSVTPGGIGGVVTVAFRGAAVAAGSECAGPRGAGRLQRRRRDPVRARRADHRDRGRQHRAAPARRDGERVGGARCHRHAGRDERHRGARRAAAEDPAFALRGRRSLSSRQSMKARRAGDWLRRSG